MQVPWNLYICTDTKIVMTGFYDHHKVRNMLKECLKMSKFDHRHVLTLKGVCLDGGPAPYILMPLMANGSLLAYLRKNKKTLVVSSKSNDDVSNTCSCDLQIFIPFILIVIFCRWR